MGVRIVQEQQAGVSSGGSERVLSQDDFHNPSHLCQQTLSSRPTPPAAPPPQVSQQPDMISSVWFLMVFYLCFLVSTGVALVGQCQVFFFFFFFGGSGSGFDPSGCHAGRPTAALSFLTQIRIRIELTGQKFPSPAEGKAVLSTFLCLG